MGTPVKEALIMSTKSVFISPTLTLIRTRRLSLLSPQWGSDISISMGGGISKSATWILPCTGTIGVRVCRENGCARRIFLCFRVNPLVESDRCLEVESPLRSVAAIPRPGRTRSRISWPTNAIAVLVSRTRTPAVRNFTIGVESHNRGHYYAKDRIATKTTARKVTGSAQRNRPRPKWPRPYAGSSQPLQRESGRSQETHGGFTGQEGRSRHQRKTARLLPSPSTRSIKQL